MIWSLVWPSTLVGRGQESLSFCARTSWMGGRVVEGTGLENRHTGNGIVSSNLTLSAWSTVQFELFRGVRRAARAICAPARRSFLVGW